MTQRDNPAAMALLDSSDSEEPQSVVQPTSSWCAAEPAAPREHVRDARPEEHVNASSAALEPDHAAAASRRDRPTLMGLAPIDADEAPDIWFRESQDEAARGESAFADGAHGYLDDDAQDEADDDAGYAAHGAGGDDAQGEDDDDGAQDEASYAAQGVGGDDTQREADDKASYAAQDVDDDAQREEDDEASYAAQDVDDDAQSEEDDEASYVAHGVGGDDTQSEEDDEASYAAHGVGGDDTQGEDDDDEASYAAQDVSDYGTQNEVDDAGVADEAGYAALYVGDDDTQGEEDGDGEQGEPRYAAQDLTDYAAQREEDDAEAPNEADDDETDYAEHNVGNYAARSEAGDADAPDEADDSDADYAEHNVGNYAARSEADDADAPDEADDDEADYAAHNVGNYAARSEADDAAAYEERARTLLDRAVAAASGLDGGRLRASTVATFVGRAPERPDQLDEDESEWLDLSTKWVVAVTPRVEPEISDDSEVTNDLYWAERLAVNLVPRADSRSSAPPPPAAAPAPRRHATLAGISPLVEEPVSPPTPGPRPTLESARARPLAPVRLPRWDWGDELSYSHGERPRFNTSGQLSTATNAPQRTSWVAPNTPATANPLPPWAAQPKPAGTHTQPLAVPQWNGTAQHVAPPPWEAPPAFRMPVQPAPLPAHYYPAPAISYAQSDRHPTQQIDYPAPRRATGSTASVQAARKSRTPSNDVVTFEQLKNLADGWLGAVGKLAIAAMALHYSGLAEPLLAQFGYSPAPSTPQYTAGVASDSAAHAPASAAAMIAAPSGIGEPTATSQRGDATAARRPERGSDSAEELRLSPRRRSQQREDGSIERTHTRRRGAKLSRSHRSRSSAKKAADTEEQDESEATAESAEAPQSSAVTQPLAAAAEPTEEPTEEAGEAFLRLNSRPWSQVFVDGTMVGHTPKIDLRVSPGSHRIRMVNPELGLSKTIQVDAVAGETVTHVELLEE